MKFTKLDKRAKRRKQRFENKCVSLLLRLFKNRCPKKKPLNIQTSFAGICISQLKKDIARKAFCKKRMIFGSAMYIFSQKTFVEKDYYQTSKKNRVLVFSIQQLTQIYHSLPVLQNLSVFLCGKLNACMDLERCNIYHLSHRSAKSKNGKLRVLEA